MANRERGEIEVELGGAKRKLRPSFEALCEIEDAAGMGIPALLAGSQKGKLGFKAVAAILYGGLRGAGSELSFDQVGELIRAEGLAGLILPAFRFLNEAMMSDSQRERAKAAAEGKDQEKLET